ncbi:MAG: hypothetical protein ACK4K0_01645 [Flavobacteriales bacterium]
MSSISWWYEIFQPILRASPRRKMPALTIRSHSVFTQPTPATKQPSKNATLAKKTQYGFIVLDEQPFLKYKRKLGLKEYELTNHLGNVMAVVTDRKITVQGANITCFMQQKPMTDFYIPNVVSYSDYFPAGC